MKTKKENGCKTCKYIDRDGKHPCTVCGDVTPYDMYEPRFLNSQPNK